jgi:hypothetical protein
MHSATQRPVVIIIPSYNNAQWVEKNLSSVFMQQYDNYRVIYIDDCSQDQTYKLATQITKMYKQENRTTIVRNNGRSGALANLYTAIHACDDACIIVTLDGDDWLAHEQVLSTVNRYYDKDIWMTYGQFQEYPTHTCGHCVPFPETIINNNAFRTFHTEEALLPASHLRTFYAWLFKSIPLKDLLTKNSFYPMAWDIAFICPMLEMSGYRQVCIDEILYIYNRSNPLSDCYKNATLQRQLAKHILTQKPFSALNKPPVTNIADKHGTTSIVLLAPDGLDAIFDTIVTIKTYIKPITTIYIFYQAQQRDKQVLEDLRSLFPSINWQQYTAKTFKRNLQNFLDALDDAYILFLTDNVTITSPIDCTAWARMLNRTQTSVAYLGLSKNDNLGYVQELAPVNLDHSIYAWLSTNRKELWFIPFINGTIWHKNDLQKILACYEYATVDQLESGLQKYSSQNGVLGLMGLHAATITTKDTKRGAYRCVV